MSRAISRKKPSSLSRSLLLSRIPRRPHRGGLSRPVDPRHPPSGQPSRHQNRPHQTVPPPIPPPMAARLCPTRRPRSLIRTPPSCLPWARRPRCRRPVSRFHRLPGPPSLTLASRSHRHPAKLVVGPRRRLAALLVAGPVRPQLAAVLRWVVVPASRCPVRVPDVLAGPVVAPEADLVVQEGDPVARVVALEGVAHRAVRGVAVVAVKNFSRWTCRPTHPMTRRCPRARWSSSAPARLWTWDRG